MINNITDVKEKELSNQIKYLKQSSVPQVGDAIEKGIYKL